MTRRSMRQREARVLLGLLVALFWILATHQHPFPSSTSPSWVLSREGGTMVCLLCQISQRGLSLQPDAVHFVAPLPILIAYLPSIEQPLPSYRFRLLPDLRAPPTSSGC